ncbi:MAG: hypothetical protein COZ06_13180 [Armatimonadetes bacterium CG_4_10_14_3_um_filter_66_18]|nr:hypothetical protein [Armatimonadota bacterium]OIP03078.1 MAG: hypothetical protein AUJ96_15270 [Armatimonadetes bacterium CG2_30_66_41]PIU95035.1 MAG: hypothetical protein COS65_04450 [Armatimonadetes bacterium CG06_land_8_20_14_3_00_66_21]PIX45292.1 MAG: hypothetical protein COZ57_15855 [Armatimonadetes bacterium CG_4_8_14_3_um_filter_66_20]PIY49698.1 MAG: hypothetical protein COZ06_13180 [Armatimonadetes bacterium CG_4_10_14_3_um_filter_66_18]PIZ49233.1 MAG: hypothetical protein COY42_04
MTQKLKVIPVTVRDSLLFTIELLDERPDGFSACVPELAIYTCGATEAQTLNRVRKHVAEKYEDLVSSPVPLNENEREWLRYYRTVIGPGRLRIGGNPGSTLPG